MRHATIRPVTGERWSSTCVVCGPTSVGLVHRKDPYRIVRCEGCELVYVEGASALGNLNDFYGEEYFYSSGESVCGYRDYTRDEELHARNARALLSEVERLTPRRGALLDVGCAHGFLLEAAHGRGWRSVGVDISSKAIHYAREKLGQTAFEGDLGSCHFPPESFDAVCMIGSIEHMTDPMRALTGAARLLTRGGVLVVTTIDIEGWLGYFSWKPPEHLFYFSFWTLSRLIARAGLAVESKRTYWSQYRASDLAGRLWGYWDLPRAGRVWKMMEAVGADRLSIRIPTNEVLVAARKP